MCGIFGATVSAKAKSSLSDKELDAILMDFFKFSMSRGKDSSGISFKSKHKIHTFKKDIPGNKFIHHKKYLNLKNEALKDAPEHGFQAIGHCRMVTNGSSENPLNNQPVEKLEAALVHNGIICNVENLWQENPSFKRIKEVDSEIIIDLIEEFIAKGNSLIDAIKNLFLTIEGAASFAYVSQRNDSLVLASNTGSLYYAHSKEDGILLFASEEYILKQCLKNLSNKFPTLKAKPVGERSMFILDRNSFELKHEQVHYKIKKNTSNDTRPKDGTNIKNQTFGKHLIYKIDDAMKLKRCTRCVLPESFPFIEFDKKGECNFCKTHIKVNQQNKKDEFLEVVKSFRKPNSKFDCVVPFSGGRDSSFGLHYMVKELGLRPITYTYDWGMVTDLARRNISRMCSALGVENILISADIKTKRSNIRKNVSAWLKQPNLGMIPLFMAGDKQFLYYVNKIKQQTNVDIDVWMSNSLENTEFKAGFCGIKPNKNKEEIDQLKLSAKFQMLYFYAKNFLTNPSYLNSSIVDTLFSYFAYYIEPRQNFTLLFDYIPWNEDLLNSTLLDQYAWETSPDSPSTWRIGDGTASFYNYVYFTMAGFSEVDTFRSNQVREGMITRDEALELVQVENAPRFESIKWYLDTIGLNYDEAIQVINKHQYRY